MSDLAVHHSSKTAEHYTPAAVLDLVLEVMGGIDLDPCADPGCRVPAMIHYTAEIGGLRQPWAGRVYMNPPYGREIGSWVDRLVDQYQAGKVEEAIALVPARVDTLWFKRLTAHGGPVLFWRGRLAFVGNDGPAPFPSALVYMGPRRSKFSGAASRYGDVWRMIMPEGERPQVLGGAGVI